MRRKTLGLVALVAVLGVLGVLVGLAGPTATSAGISPTPAGRSASGFTLVAGLLAVVVGGRYLSIQR